MKLKLSLLLSTFALSFASYAFDFQSNEFYFNKISENEVEITYDTYENASYSGVIHIPATVDYEGKTYSITAIGEKAFYSSDITDIQIPETITKIGNFAFYFCESLKNVTLPQSLKTLPTYMLAGTQIEALAIPQGVTSIGNGFLQSCPSLTSLFIGDQVKSIGSYGFYACHALREIYCLTPTPPNATAFAVFQGLTTIDIIVPDESVDKYATTSPWSNFDIYPSEVFTMAMTVQGENDGNYDIISLGDAKAYKIYKGDELIAITAANRYFIPNTGTPTTYSIVPSNYFYDSEPHSYTTTTKGGVENLLNDDISIYCSRGTIFVNGNIENQKIEIYNIYGQLVSSVPAVEEYNPTLNASGVYIVKVGSKVKKVIL